MGSRRSDKENKEAIDTALCFCNSNSRDLNRNRNKYRRQKPLTVAEDKQQSEIATVSNKLINSHFYFTFWTVRTKNCRLLQCYVPITASPLYKMDHSAF